MEKIVAPFEFNGCINILKSTGKKAKSLRELRDIISVVGEEAIFHHTYQYFLKVHTQEYTNDFAHWAGESLEERILAEELSNIDPYDFRKISHLRQALLNVIDRYLERFPEPRAAMPGDEFFFNKTITFTFPMGIKANNLAEFLMGIKYIDPGCVYYHFYEARIRHGTDDFSKWFEDVLEKKELAERIRGIDPFMHTIEGIRERIGEAVEREVKKDMEIVGGGR